MCIIIIVLEYAIIGLVISEVNYLKNHHSPFNSFG